MKQQAIEGVRQYGGGTAESSETPQGNARPVFNAEPTRADQTKCPYCHHWGCPCVGGVRRRSDGAYRYRRCSCCQRPHMTLESERVPGVEQVIG